ncbi:MAG: DUF5666 domain-containing protein [Gammaproteobacteria bacterium]
MWLSADKCLVLLASIMLTAFIAGCGGGGSGGSVAGGGIGGTGITNGTITGFGSVFVNGIEFETSGTSFDVDDDSAAVEGDLGIGMVVTVVGVVNSDGVSGTATSIKYDDEVEGPIAAIPVEDADMVTKTFVVLGIPIVVDRNDTVFVNTDYDSLAQNDRVEISGYYAGSQLLATRLENTGPGTKVETRGTVTGFDTIDTFMLGAVTVTFDGTTQFEDLPGTVADNQFVEVAGTLTGPAAILATRIELEDEGFGDDVDEISIEGIVSDFINNGDFKVAGQAVDASAAFFEPAGLAATIADGDRVEVEGAIVAGVLMADEVEQRGGEVRLGAIVDTRDPAAGTVTLSIVGSQLTVHTSTRTQIEDERDGVEPFAIVNMQNGDYLHVEAYVDGSGMLIATQIERDDLDDIELQGPADVPPTSGTSGSGTVSILGITIATDSNTDFENANDAPISGDTFFGSASNGDMVRFRDNQVPDGIADDVEFED